MRSITNAYPLSKCKGTAIFYTYQIFAKFFLKKTKKTLQKNKKSLLKLCKIAKKCVTL